MTTFSAPFPTPSRPTGRALALWADVLGRLARGGSHDPSLRAGAERPAAPMLMSISLGGPAHLR